MLQFCRIFPILFRLYLPFILVCFALVCVLLHLCALFWVRKLFLFAIFVYFIYCYSIGNLLDLNASHPHLFSVGAWSFHLIFTIFMFFCIFVLALGSGGRWTQWMDWGTCTTECIQIRRRTCIDVNYDSITTSPAVSKLSMDGNEKSACTGRDLQTRDCRGGYCTIGKEGKYHTFRLLQST